MEDETELVSRIDRRQDDSAGGTARDVQTRGFNGYGSKGEPRRLCLPTTSRGRADCEGRKGRRDGRALTGPELVVMQPAWLRPRGRQALPRGQTGWGTGRRRSRFAPAPTTPAAMANNPSTGVQSDAIPKRASHE